MGLTCIEHPHLSPSSGSSGSLHPDSYLYAFHYLRNLRLAFTSLCRVVHGHQKRLGGMFNRTVAISYPNFKSPITTWILGKADSYLKQLEARGRVQAINSDTHQPSL